MQYSFRPRLRTRSRVPRLPLRPPDHYLREAMSATLARAGRRVRLPRAGADRRPPHADRERVACAGRSGCRPSSRLRDCGSRSRRSTRRRSSRSPTTCPSTPGTASPTTGRSGNQSRGATPPLLRAVPAPPVDERHSAHRADRRRGVRASDGWSASEAGEVAERAEARQEEVGAAPHGDELRQPGDPASQPGGLRKREGARAGQPGKGSRLPRSGSLSSERPSNLALIIQALCTNSNWRAMLASRQMKWSPDSPSGASTAWRADSTGGTGPYSRPRRRSRWKRVEAIDVVPEALPAEAEHAHQPADETDGPPGRSPVRGLARRMWAPSGQRMPSASASKVKSL